VKALVLANHGDKYKDIKLSTAGILFLGTPHSGSDSVTKGKWIATIAGNDTTLLESLKSGSTELFHIAHDFASASKDLITVCYYEKRKSTYVGGLQKVEVSEVHLLDCNYRMLKDARSSVLSQQHFQERERFT
jgi:hypothetical protein